MGPQWVASGPGQVWHQNGMLTLNATSEGTVSATLAGPGAEVGRWETRLRSRQYGRGDARYQVLAELVPAAGAEENCGGSQHRAGELHAQRQGGHRLCPHAAQRRLQGDQPGMDLGRDRGTPTPSR